MENVDIKFNVNSSQLDSAINKLKSIKPIVNVKIGIDSATINSFKSTLNNIVIKPIVRIANLNDVRSQLKSVNEIKCNLRIMNLSQVQRQIQSLGGRINLNTNVNNRGGNNTTSGGSRLTNEAIRELQRDIGYQSRLRYGNNSNINNVTRNTMGGGSSSSTLYGNLNRGFIGFQNALNNATSKILNMTVVAGTVAVGYAALNIVIGAFKTALEAVTESLKSGFKFLSDSEQSLAKYSTFLREGTTNPDTSTTSKKIYEEVLHYAAVTPYESTDINEAMSMFMGYGSNAAESQRLTGATTRLAMGDPNKVYGISLALAQIKAMGRLQGQDKNQLINRQVPIMDLLSESTGKSTGELQNMMEDKAISWSMVAEAINKATLGTGRYAKSMEKMSQTVMGRLSTIRDNFKMTMGKILEPLYNGFRDKILPIIITLTTNLQNFVKYLNETGKGVEIFSSIKKEAMDLADTLIAMTGGEGFIKNVETLLSSTEKTNKKPEKKVKTSEDAMREATRVSKEVAKNPIYNANGKIITPLEPQAIVKTSEDAMREAVTTNYKSKMDKKIVKKEKEGKDKVKETVIKGSPLEVTFKLISEAVKNSIKVIKGLAEGILTVVNVIKLVWHTGSLAFKAMGNGIQTLVRGTGFLASAFLSVNENLNNAQNQIRNEKQYEIAVDVIKLKSKKENGGLSKDDKEKLKSKEKQLKEIKAFNKKSNEEYNKSITVADVEAATNFKLDSLSDYKENAEGIKDSFNSLVGDTKKIKTNFTENTIKTIIESYSGIKKKTDKGTFDEGLTTTGAGVDTDALKEAADAQKKLAKDIKDAMDDIKSAIESATESILKFGNAFTRISYDKYSPAKLLRRSTKNLQKFKKWQDNLNKLKGMGVSDNILNELRMMGIEGMGIAEGLVKSNAEQRKQILGNYGQMQGIALEQGTKTVEYNYNINMGGVVKIENKDGEIVKEIVVDEVSKQIKAALSKGKYNY